MSGWGEGDGGNVQVTIADVRYAGFTRDTHTHTHTITHDHTRSHTHTHTHTHMITLSH